MSLHEKDLMEEVAHAIAVSNFMVTAEADEEWNERAHFKVPVIVYMAAARAAIKRYRELTVLPDEVESVARAMWHDEAMRYADVPLEDWRKVEEFDREDWLRLARAALQATAESRRDIEDDLDKALGEINDVLSILASRGYEVNKDRPLIRNVRQYLKTPKEMADGQAEA